MRVMRLVVDEALSLIPSADGAVVELCSDDVLTYVCAAGTLADHVGVHVPMQGSLSGLAVQQRTTLRCDDSETDPRTDGPLSAAVGAVSMICVPLVRGDDVVGALKLSSTSRAAFADADVTLLTDLAAFIGAAIGGWADMAQSAAALLPPETDGASGSSSGRSGRSARGSVGALGGSPTGPGERRHPRTQERVSRFVANVLRTHPAQDPAARKRIEDVLLHGAITIVFQPIFELKTGKLAGCEALSRFPGSPARPPDLWFAEAQAVGLGPELQLLAVREALKQLSSLPNRCYLGVNVGHDVAAHPELLPILERVDASLVVVELTEHLQVEDYSALITAVGAIREQGARVAIDDTGAGFAGFSHILKLAPDLIKLDRILTTGVDTDPARQALAGALVNFASATRSRVIAEGIETIGELDVVRALGIHYGQGYFLGRPGPVAALATTAKQRRGSIAGR